MNSHTGLTQLSNKTAMNTIPITPEVRTLCQTLASRASIRHYTHEDVDNETLNLLLSQAARTQTMGNLQLYSVVITRDTEAKKRLAPFHFNQPMVTEAPVVLTFCADYHRTSAWCRLREAEPGYDNFLSFINAATDALLFCQTFCTLAEAAGLGLCYLGTTIYQPMGIINELHLPRLVMPVATITLGHPAEKPHLSDRLPLTAFAHLETYTIPGVAEIDRDYKAREALEENRHFCEINHKKTLAQIFTDIRYTRKDCEAMSESFLQALRHQGFLPEK